MKTLFKAACLAAGICTTALAAGGVVTSAQAGDVHIYVADLNLQTPAGVAAYNARVDSVAKQMCDGYEHLKDMNRSTCIQAVREEAREHLERLARQGDARIASARH